MQLLKASVHHLLFTRLLNHYLSEPNIDTAPVRPIFPRKYQLGYARLLLANTRSSLSFQKLHTEISTKLKHTLSRFPTIKNLFHLLRITTLDLVHVMYYTVQCTHIHVLVSFIKRPFQRHFYFPYRIAKKSKRIGHEHTDTESFLGFFSLLLPFPFLFT